MSTELPDFRTMTTVDDLRAAYAALVETARNNGVQMDAAETFDSVETGIAACERLSDRIAGTTKATATEEADLASKTKKKSARKRVTAAKTNGGGPRHGSKTEAIAKMLGRASGCTAEDVRKLTGWPAVSMPAMAKACGLKLRKEKEKGKPTRYFGE